MEIKKMVVPFELTEVKQNEHDDEHFYFEGYASTFSNVDLGSDRVMHGAFKECIDRLRASGKRIPVLFSHDFNKPIGVFDELREDPKGLFVKGRMPKEDTRVSGMIIPQMKIGSLGSMSIGYQAVDWEIEGDVRNLKTLNLFEVSLVTMPMNTEAVVTGMKAAVPYKNLPLADTGRTWDSSAAKKRIREFTKSEDEPSARYKNAFLWYDSENADNFGAYKLPIADVIDGELKAVPRAIFASAAAIQGARGGVDIPESDISTIKSNITKYYKKMDRDSPFDGKCLVIHKEMLDVLTERDVDNVLRSNIKMTRSAAKKFMSCLNVKSLRDVGESVARDAEKDAIAGIKRFLEEIRKI